MRATTISGWVPSPFLGLRIASLTTPAHNRPRRTSSSTRTSRTASPSFRQAARSRPSSASRPISTATGCTPTRRAWTIGCAGGGAISRGIWGTGCAVRLGCGEAREMAETRERLVRHV